MEDRKKETPPQPEPLRLTRRAALFGGAAAAALSPALARRALAQQQPYRPAPGRQRADPPLPWSNLERRALPPGEPGRDYTPVFTPNGVSLPFRIVDGVKVFHLVAEPIVHEIAEGLTVKCFGFNGRTPGPTIEGVEGDRIRVYVTNRLPTFTTVHWHGQILPCGMDGVPGLTQPAIAPGQTVVYEFTLAFPGTYMYHPHVDSMTEEGLGMVGMMVVHPRRRQPRPPDRDFAIMLMEWEIDGGVSRPNPNEMVEFNVLTMNGRAFPDTYPLVAKIGDLVRIRLGNLSQMHHHPIHLHGYSFNLVATDGGEIPASARWPEVTVLVPVGSTRDVEFIADNPGDWMMHCHMTHHMMNQMGHGFPNMIGVDVGDLDRKIQSLLPAYMTMGQHGMADMATMKMPVPENSIPMRGFTGQFGPTVMGGMATVLKVRHQTNGYEDPGWYEFPEGTLPWLASEQELQRDGVELPEMEAMPPEDRHRGHEGHGEGD